MVAFYPSEKKKKKKAIDCRGDETSPLGRCLGSGEKTPAGTTGICWFEREVGGGAVRCRSWEGPVGTLSDAWLQGIAIDP